jgi:hypothetical protein
MVFDADGSELDENNLLDSGDKIVVDIGYLRDIDHSPQNIKELSQLMANQIESLLNKEINKINAD